MLFIIAALAGLACAIFLFGRARRADDEGDRMPRDPGDAIRRGQWTRQAEGTLIERIGDPREAAAVLLVQIAAYDGEVTAGQKARIKSLMAASFDCDDETAEGLYSFGRMVIGQINDAANSLSRLMSPIRENLTLAEMKDFVGMLETVAEVEGAANDRQRHLVAAVRRALSLSAVE